MLAAQALKQRRALEEDLERHHHHHHHEHRHGQHEHGHEDGGEERQHSDGEEGMSESEEEVFIEVPKYLQGIPLVDKHSEIEGTYVVIAKNLAGLYQVNRFSAEKSCYLFGPRNKVRKFTSFIITHRIFELIILITILTNCIFLALNNPPTESEIVFAVIYTTEMFLKVFAKGFFFPKFAYLRNSWNWLDFICVIVGYLSFHPVVSNFSVVRTFRVLRALRTISAVKGLKAMVNTLMKSIKMLSDVMILTTFFICVFALIGLQLFKGTLHSKCVRNILATNVSNDYWHDFVHNEDNWIINNGFPFVCGNGTYSGHCPANYTCLKQIGANPPSGKIPFISFDNFLWSLLTSLQLVTLDSWEIVYNVVIGANGQVYVLYFLFVVLLGPFYLINLVLAVVSLSYEIESQALQDEDLKEKNYLTLQRSASSYDFDCKEMPEALYLDDVPQRPDESRYEPENAPPTRTPTPSSNNALELGEALDQEPSGCCMSCRTTVNKMVESPFFEGFITACILLNTLCMGLEYHGMDKTFKKVLEYCNLVFTVVFILEMIFKLVALGFRKYLKVTWNVFDGVIVIMSIVDMSMEYSNAGGAGGVLSVLRTFRLLRVLKLAKSWKTMGDLLATIGKSVGAMGNITVILLILMFIFAVVGMQLFRDVYTEKIFPEGVPRWNFKDFPRSFMMVFRIICGKWIEPCWDLMRAAGEAAFLYILMVFIIGQWIVLNLFLALLLSSFSDNDEDVEKKEEEKKEKKKKKKFSLLRFFKRKKKGRVTPNASKEDLGDDETKREELNENHEPGLTMLNGKGGDPGNCISTRAASGESARSEVESIKHGTVDGDPSHASFPVSVVVDETKENHLKANNNGSPFDHVQNSTEQLNVANGGGHGVPNGNSHKGSSLDLKRSSSDVSQSSATPNGERRESVQDSIGTGMQRNSSIRGSRRPTMMIQGEDGRPVAPDCYPAFCYKDGICSICSPSFKGSKIRKLWTAMRTKINFFVEHKYFESFILFLIVVSSLSLAFEDVYLKNRKTLSDILKYSNYFFAIIFGLEFLLKLIGYGVVCYFTSFWNLLDVFIVAISVATLSGNENLNALRSLRALRPLRAVSKFEGMKIVINSLVLSIPAIVNVVLVCLVFWLIFAIMGYQFFGGKFYKCIDNTTKERLNATFVPNRVQCIEKGYRWINSKINYDDAFSGFLALFQVATLEGYMEVIFDSVDAVGVDKQPIKNNDYAINIFYVVFITMGSFFILNLFIGVIIENFSRLKQQYEDNDAMGMFLTPSQRIWVNTVCRTYMKRPKTQPKRPRAEWRGKIYDLIQSRSFEFFIMTIIILNIITMMAEHHNQTDEFTAALTILNWIFTVLFIIEAILRLLALRSDYFKSGWNLFDFTIVIFSITEIVLDAHEIQMPFSPGLLRVVRVFRLARLLRFFEGAKGIRSLLFALVKSLPGLANIGCLLFLFMFIYACIGMSLWGNVKHTGYLDDVVNFSTFFSSLLLLFRIATAAGWNTILEPMMVTKPDCNPDKVGLPQGGDCGNPLLAVVYFVSYILLIFLVTVNMYIAVILENFNEAQQQDEIGLCEEDMDAYISTWETFDPKATQFIHYRDLTHFLDALDPPLRIPKPNEEEFANMDVAVRQGDQVHCLDLMLALVKRVIGDNEDLTDDDKANMYEKFEERFQSAFPQRRATPKLYTILQRYKQETAAAIRLQRAFREWQQKVQKKKDKFHKYAAEEKEKEKDDVWREKQLTNESRPGSTTSNRPRTASSPRKRAPLAKQETIDSPLPQNKNASTTPMDEQPNTNSVRETAENFKNDPFAAEAMNMMWFSRGGNGQKSSESAV